MTPMGDPVHHTPSAAERRASVVAQVPGGAGAVTVGADPEALEISLVSKLDREMSFGDVAQFARTRGYDWRDVYLVISKLTAKGFLRRTAHGADIAPPPLVAGPDKEDKQLQAWTEWSKRAQCVWRSALG